MALQINKQTKIKILKDMLLIRRFEEKSAQMYGLRKIGGFCHLYIGEEAIAAGAIAALDLKKDYVIGAYRDHGYALACGISADSIMAELYGKATGCSRGKGGSMHLYDAEKHMLGGNGIVGGQIPVAAGVGLKIRNKKENGVVLCFFGDGAIHQGSFHESLNIARIYRLPVIFICENNQYGMGTDFRRVSAVDDFSVMGASYGIPGKQLDGMNAFAVYSEIKAAVTEMRKEALPRFYEIKTYRYKGHSMSDPAKYRSREELDSYKEQDPILIAKKKLINEKILTEDQFLAFDEEAKGISRQAADFAETSPEPAPEELYQDIFA